MYLPYEQFRVSMSVCLFVCLCLFICGYVFLWPPYVIGQATYYCPVVSSSSIFFFFSHLFSAVADWMSTILPHMVWS